MLVVRELGLIDLEPTGISSWLRREVNGIAHLVAMAVALMTAALRSPRAYVAVALAVVVDGVDVARWTDGWGWGWGRATGGLALARKFGGRDARARTPSWTDPSAMNVDECPAVAATHMYRWERARYLTGGGEVMEQSRRRPRGLTWFSAGFSYFFFFSLH